MIVERIKARYYGIIESMVFKTPDTTKGNAALGRSVRRFVNRHVDSERYTTVLIKPKRTQVKRRKANRILLRSIK